MRYSSARGRGRRFHVDQFALALAQRLHHAALVLVLDVGGDQLDRLAGARRRCPWNTTRGLPPPARSPRGACSPAGWSGAVRRGPRPRTRRPRRFPSRAAPRCSAAPFCRRSQIWRLVTNLPSRPASGLVLTQKFIGQRRLVDLQHRQRLRVARVGHGHADADVLDAVDQHDVAGPASVACTRSRPSKVSTWLMRPLTRGRPGLPSPARPCPGDGAGVDAAHADAADEGL